MLLSFYMADNHVLASNVRMKCKDDIFWIYHGVVAINITFGDVLDYLKQFLRANPKETVIMQYQTEGDPDDCTKDFQTLFKEEYERYLDSSMQFSLYSDGTRNLKLGQTRGKVVLIDWFDKDNSITTAISGGTDLGFNRPDSQKIENTYEGITSIGGMGMDAYEKRLEDNIRNSQYDREYRGFYVTFLSAIDAPWDDPEDFAKEVNPHIRKYLQQHRDNGKYGAILMDFPSHGLVDEIISNNPGTDIIFYCIFTITHLYAQIC